MNIQKLIVEFVTVFVVALMTSAIVTLQWNIIGHGATAVDWETSFRFAIIIGMSLTWTKSRAIKEKSNLSNVPDYDGSQIQVDCIEVEMIHPKNWQEIRR